MKVPPWKLKERKLGALQPAESSSEACHTVWNILFLMQRWKSLTHTAKVKEKWQMLWFKCLLLSFAFTNSTPNATTARRLLETWIHHHSRHHFYLFGPVRVKQWLFERIEHTHVVEYKQRMAAPGCMSMWCACHKSNSKAWLTTSHYNLGFQSLVWQLQETSFSKAVSCTCHYDVLVEHCWDPWQWTHARNLMKIF